MPRRTDVNADALFTGPSQTDTQWAQRRQTTLRQRRTAKNNQIEANGTLGAAVASIVILLASLFIFPEAWREMYHTQPLVLTVPVLWLAAAIIWVAVHPWYYQKQQSLLNKTEGTN